MSSEQAAKISGGWFPFAKADLANEESVIIITNDITDEKREIFRQKNLAEQVLFLTNFADKSLKNIAKNYTVNKEDTDVNVLLEVVRNLDYSKSFDVEKLLLQKKEFWSTIIEIHQEEHIASLIATLMYIHNKQFDLAENFLKTHTVFFSQQSWTGFYSYYLFNYMDIFREKLENKIRKGIQYFDEGKLLVALYHFEDILNVCPYSAFALHEYYLTKYQLGKFDDNEMKKYLHRMFVESDPMYNASLFANNKKELFQLQQRRRIVELRRQNLSQYEFYQEMAKIALDLDVYDMSAIYFWKASLLSETSKDFDENLCHFAYSLDRFNILQSDEFFIENYSKKFQTIDEKQAMKWENNEAKNNYDFVYQEVQKKIQSGDVEGALYFLNTIVTTNNDSFDAITLRAQVYFDLGSKEDNAEYLENAMQDFEYLVNDERAKTQKDFLLYCYEMLANLSNYFKNHEKSIFYLDKLIMENHEIETCYFNKAKIYFSLKKYQNALETLDNLLK